MNNQKRILDLGSRGQQRKTVINNTHNNNKQTKPIFSTYLILGAVGRGGGPFLKRASINGRSSASVSRASSELASAFCS